ncbi:apyrase [Acrasis kona]|uniref:Apyrase n=1 Tax=Acrasis kona TaxID=1008807 RepID=A0AAW2Z045_9EUKA
MHLSVVGLFFALFTLTCAQISSINYGRIVQNLSPQDPSQKMCYGVVFDAGSSGTRVYVYKWECRKTSSTPRLQVSEQIPEKSIRGGISKFSSNPNAAGPSLIELINFAKGIVPSEQLSWTPIFLRATAGMRLITPDQQAAILDSIRKTFRESGFRFEDEGWARVITGQEEGAYGWVASNYLHDLIKKQVDGTKTRAMMECGGASLQITFVQPQDPPKNKININFPDINQYVLYTHSYLGYGQDQARNEVIKASIVNPNDDTVISPCYNKNFNSTNVFSGNPNLRVIGSGDATKCAALIKDYMKLDPACKDCSIGGNYYPGIPEGMSIDGLGSFVFVNQFYNFTDSFSANALFARVNDFCSSEWSSVQRDHKVDEFLSTRCFSGIYVSQLLTSAFRVDPDTAISARSKIKDVTVVWTLGSMLFDMSTLRCSPGTEDCIYDDDRYKKALLYTFISVLSFAIVVVVLTVIIVAVRRRQRQRMYNRV